MGVRSAVGLALVGLSFTPALAFSSGISGFSGNPDTNDGFICSICHSGGIVPQVALLGPNEVEIGTVATYTLRVRGGQSVAAGFDVSVTSGSLSVVEAGTQVLDGEMTHTMRRPVDALGQVLFQFDWTAPGAPGSVTMYGAGNSVNGNGSPAGDAPAAASLAINVVPAAAATPGETAGPAIAPLLVTDYDPGTGALSLTWGVACESTDHNIYYGPLSAVATWGWSSSTCDTGAAGSTAFNPGPGSFFFVVVGTKGVDEGSYGTSRIGGVTAERPAYPTSACAQVQTLTDRCDLP